MRVSFSPGYYAPIPSEHIFPMGKFEGLYRYLLDRDIIDSSRVVQPGIVDMTQLMTVHSARYAHGVMNGTLDPGEVRRLGLPWSYRLARRSRLAVQGTINASIMALQDGIAGNIAGGTHHAMPDHGEGFCVFNDVAVAVRVLRNSMWIRKTLIIDCDVHQGNGTADIFRDDPEVFTFSIHGKNNYPFQKAASTMDVGLPDGTGDRDYHRALIDSLDQIFFRFDPDLVYYLGGIDPLEADHFGKLSLSPEGLAERDRIVLETVRKHDKPVVLTLSGGYAPTLLETVEAHAEMYRCAMEIY